MVLQPWVLLHIVSAVAQPVAVKQRTVFPQFVYSTPGSYRAALNCPACALAALLNGMLPCMLSLQHHTAVSQALALIPNASRPFVPFRARSFCTQQQRQQVANKLLGGYLVLLLQELSVEPGKQQKVRLARRFRPVQP